MRSKRVLRVGAFSIWAVGIAHAQTTWLVSNDPSELPDFASLGAALASPSVQANDTIEISEGLGPYVESVEVSESMRIRGQGSERPLLRPAGIPDEYAIRVMPAVTSSVFIEGLRFEKGTGTRGAVYGGRLRDCRFEGFHGIAVVTGGHIMGCDFVDCTTDLGEVLIASGLIEDCTFSTSNPPSHGGVFGGAGSTFLNCRFSGGPVGLVRFAPSGARYINCTFENTTLRPDQRLFGHDQAPARWEFDNCLFVNISSDQPLIQGAFDEINLRGCTIVDCAAPALIQYFGSTSNPGVVVVRNSIIWGNAFAALATLFDGTLDVAWSITQSVIPGPGNLSTDPLFANPGAGDYSLNRGSPGVDSGDSFAVPAAITTDILGNPRRIDDPHKPDTGIGAPVVDRGAYEFQLPGPGFCPADLTTAAIPGAPGYGTPNGIVNNDDFFYYLTLFVGAACGDPGQPACPSPPDLTTTATIGQPGFGILDGRVTNDDFFYYLLLFAAGC